MKLRLAKETSLDEVLEFSWIVPFYGLSFNNSGSNLLLESSNFYSVEAIFVSNLFSVLELGKAEELAVEDSLLSAFNLLGVGLAPAWVDAGHVTTESLASLKMFITLLAVLTLQFLLNFLRIFGHVHFLLLGLFRLEDSRLAALDFLDLIGQFELHDGTVVLLADELL